MLEGAKASAMIGSPLLEITVFCLSKCLTVGRRSLSMIDDCRVAKGRYGERYGGEKEEEEEEENGRRRSQ